MSAPDFVNHSGAGIPEGLSAIDWVEPLFRGPADPAKGWRRDFGFVFAFDWTHDGGPDDIIAYREGPEC